MKFRSAFVLAIICIKLNVYSQKELPLFTNTEISSSDHIAISNELKYFLTLELNLSELENLYLSGRGEFSISLPLFKGESYNLHLDKHEILSEDFRITSQTGLELKQANGHFYKGEINEMENSFVAVSVFENEFICSFSCNQGKFRIQKLASEMLQSQSKGKYILFQETDIILPTGWTCHTDDNEQIIESENADYEFARANPCVDIYFDCDHSYYLDFGGDVTALTNEVTAVFNEVSVLYDGIGIDLNISEIHIWDIADPFASTNSFDALISFYDYSNMNGFPGDLAYLLASDPGNGGIAFLGGLCSNFNLGYCDYGSWNGYTVVGCTNIKSELLAHELGHSLGSHHTHWCGWPGGPIDNCNTNGTLCGPYPNDDGPCANGPSPMPLGGTVMSYCHCNPLVGINWANGFGPLPQGAIVNFVSSQSCLNFCGTCLLPVTIIDSVNESNNSINFCWSESIGAISYQIRIRALGFPFWSEYEMMDTSLHISLSCGQNYEWQLRSVCDTNDFSSWSSIDTFYSGGCIGIEHETALNKVTIFPNPCNGSFMLRLETDLQTEAHVSIFDISGRKVYDGSIEIYSGVNQAQFELGKYGNGSYQIRIESNNRKYFLPLIIVR